MQNNQQSKNLGFPSQTKNNQPKHTETNANEVEYRIKKKIGSGSYGDVFLGEDQQNKKVAIKKIKRMNTYEGIPSSTLKEISLLKEIVHPNVIKLYSIEVIDEGKFCE